MTSDVAADTVPARADAPDTRVRLLAAARDIICEVGFKHARMEDIAARAGVSRAAVYYHFNTKRDLAAAIADDVFERLTATVRAALADGPVESVIAATVRFVVDQATLARLLIADMALPMDPVRLLGRHRDALLALLRTRIAADIAGGRIRPMDPEVAAQAVDGLLRVAPAVLLCQDSADPDHLVAELTSFLRHALAPSP